MFIIHANASAENASQGLNSSFHFADNIVFSSHKQTCNVDAAHGRFDGAIKSHTLYGTSSEYATLTVMGYIIDDLQFTRISFKSAIKPTSEDLNTYLLSIFFVEAYCVIINNILYLNQINFLF